MTASPSDPARALLRALREYQRRIAFVGRALGSELNTTDAAVVTTLDSEKPAAPTELSAILKLDKSTVSRALARLQRSGYLEIAPAPEDRRRRRLTLTPKARKFLAANDRTNALALSSCTAALSPAEEREITSLLRSMNTAENAPPLPLRPGEHPIFVELRRLAWAHGVAGSSYMDSGYSCFDWQVLSEIAAGESALRASDLCDLFALQPSTVSFNLARLERSRLIRRRRSESDARAQTLALTAAGRAALNRIEGCACERIAADLAGLAPPEARRGVELFEKFAGFAGGPGRSGQRTTLLQEQLALKELAGEDERREGRAVVITDLVRRSLQHLAPETIMGEENLCLGLYQGESLRAAAEFSRRGRRVLLHTLALAVELEGSKAELAFVRTALERAAARWRTRSVLLPRPLVPEALAERAGLAAEGPDLWRAAVEQPRRQ